MTYIFFLGNSPELAAVEIDSVLKREKISSQTQKENNCLFVSTDVEIAERVFSLLGGTIKVAVVFREVEKSNPASLLSEITTEFESLGIKNKLNKISFGLSQYAPAKDMIDIVSLSKKIKNEVNPQFKMRFVLPKFPSQELSTVVIKKQQLLDVCMVTTGEKIFLSRSIWVQDFEDWGKRDYGRPAVEGHIGMLPPKVARMMLNVGLPTETSVDKQLTTIVLDPFCGVGTVLAEGLVLGVTVIGADIDKNQVDRTRKNLSWLCEAEHISNTKYEIHLADAPNIGKFVNRKITAIVTEPDMGPNSLHLNANPAPEITNRLEGLYVACLKNWKSMLAPGGKIVIALPSFSSSGNISKDNNLYIVKTVVDKAKIMGYSISHQPFVYARPQAKVIRNICIFTSN